MPTVSRDLPAQPHLDVPKREARELLAQWRSRQPDALDRLRARHPKFAHADAATFAAATPRLADAQLVIAREYTYPTWADLKQRIASNAFSRQLEVAIHHDDHAQVLQILRDHPPLLHLHVRGGNWGPPMSYAANLGRLELIKAIAELGARDFQHAFDRALLQGKIETARWLHRRGAKLEPGSIMGACGTLNPDGLRFLVELGAPFTNEHGDRLAPLALALGTYCRDPARKHAVIEIFAQQGYALPGTPIMALHRGQIDRLASHLARDPALLDRRFTATEIYPPELGCAQDGRGGLHWTPIAGGTLLHLAVDFHEQAIFEWLLARGANVNARATIDAEGFGGHTPLFNCVVCGLTRDTAMTRALLDRGASPALRTRLRKFLDWCAQPRWHVAHDVTARQWGETFPERGWVNDAALRLLAGIE